MHACMNTHACIPKFNLGMESWHIHACEINLGDIGTNLGKYINLGENH